MFWNWLIPLLQPNFSGISGNSKQKNILQTIQKLMQFSYLLLQKEIFSGQIFFWTSSNEGEFPRGYLINAAACIFAQH